MIYLHVEFAAIVTLFITVKEVKNANNSHHSSGHCCAGITRFAYILHPAQSGLPTAAFGSSKPDQAYGRLTPEFSETELTANLRKGANEGGLGAKDEKVRDGSDKVELRFLGFTLSFCGNSGRGR
jgi:hypothetical protein